MPRTHSWTASLVFWALFAAAPAQADPAADTDPDIAAQRPPVVVTYPELGRELRSDASIGRPLQTVAPDLSPPARAVARDGAALLETTPGAAVLRNGPLTGIAQLHGLSQDRVKILVDGMSITPACSNHMDPPLHYAPPPSVGSFSSIAGVTPVSVGGDSIAGTIVVDSPRPQFAADGAVAWLGRGRAFFDGRQLARGVDGRFGAASDAWSLAYTGSWQEGDELRFDGGRAAATRFETHQHALQLASRSEWGELALDLGKGFTPYAGTPALGMDIADDDSFRVGLSYRHRFGFGVVDARVFHHQIDHVMDNFSLRSPGAMGRMEAPADSRDDGWRISVSHPLGDRHVARIGSDVHAAAFESENRNLTNGQRQTGIPDGHRRRAGTWLEWEAQWSEQWQSLVGVRNDVVLADAGRVDEIFAPMNRMMAAVLRRDRERFDASDRDRTDVAWEGMAALRWQPGFGRYELAAARKVRAPSLLERYQWTPLSASAGLADGHQYLGNLALDPEVAYQLALTGRWEGDGWEVRVAPFYTRVHDYIQGDPVPGRMDPMSGLAVLQYQNFGRVDLYGVDASAMLRLTSWLAVRGWGSWVRGRNRSSDDDLYRIMPLHGALDLDWSWRRFWLTTELALAARQNRTARYNGERETPGYALFNVSGGVQLGDRFDVTLGVSNVFDKGWAEHTSGINRVTEGDVPVGDRIPGAGRAFFASMSVRY